MASHDTPGRTVEVVADTVGDTVTPMVTAVLASAAVATRNPELGFLAVPIGAMTGALGKQGATLVIGTLRDRAERVARLLDEIASQTATPFGDYKDEHVDTDPKRRLLNSIVADATDATTEWKIRTLARAFVRGAEDEARIDETLHFVRRVMPLDPAHARFLAVVAARRQRGIPHTTYDDVGKADPGIGLATALLGSDLVEQHFLAVVREEPQLIVTPTAVGVAVSAWLDELGASAEPGRPSRRRG
jgi:hypothetical protein